MKTYATSLTASFCLLGGFFLNAQETQPDADLTGAVRHPDRVSFVMRAEPPPSPGPGEALLSRLEIRKTGQIQHGIEHFSNGTKREWWATRKYTASTAYVFGTGETVVAEMIEEGDEDHEFSFFALETVPGLRWLRRARDLGIVTLNGKACRHFVSVSKLDDGVTPRGEVWIDEKSARPLKLRNEDRMFVVEYLAPPEGSLEVPLEFQKPVIELAERQRRAEAIQNAGRR
jgi:hypothetical protein